MIENFLCTHLEALYNISFLRLMHYHLCCIKMLPCSYHHNYSAMDNICVLCPFTLEEDNIMLDALTLLDHEF